MHAIETIKLRITPDGRMNRTDAASYLLMSAKTLSNLQTRGLGPRSHRVGGRRFYRLADLEEFVRSGGAPQRQQSVL